MDRSETHFLFIFCPLSYQNMPWGADGKAVPIWRTKTGGPSISTSFYPFPKIFRVERALIKGSPKKYITLSVYPFYTPLEGFKGQSRSKKVKKWKWEIMLLMGCRPQNMVAQGGIAPPEAYILKFSKNKIFFILQKFLHSGGKKRQNPQQKIFFSKFFFFKIGCSKACWCYD